MRLSLPNGGGGFKTAGRTASNGTAMQQVQWWLEQTGRTGVSPLRPLRDQFVGEFKDEAQPSWVIACSDTYHPVYRC